MLSHFFSALLVASASFSAAQTPNPAAATKASFDTFQIPSHGTLLNAFVYIAAGPGPHPVVVLLHGFPGNERNLDVAQAMRRAGYDVLYFDYRGSWGTPGDFSFTHCMEDAQAALAYLREPENAKRLRADPAHITLVGHSMGGMVAAWVGAHDPQVQAVTLISSASMAERALLPPGVTAEGRAKAITAIAKGLAAEGMAPLAGCTPQSLAAELVEHASEWVLPASAAALAGRRVFIITSDDGGVPTGNAFAAALRSAGSTQARELHLATDHSYSDKRGELTEAILDQLSR